MAGDIPATMGSAEWLGAVGSTAIIRHEAITSPTDVDMYKFQVQAGQRIDFDIDTSTNGPPGLGSYLRIFDSQGGQLDANNDRLAPGDPPPGPDAGTEGFDSYIPYTFASAGTFYVGVSNWQHRNYNPVTGGTALGNDTRWLTGEYSLTVSSVPVDLVGTYFDADEPLRWGQSFYVDGRIANHGLASAGNSTVTFYLSADSNIGTGDYNLGSRSIGSISAGSSSYFGNHPLQLPSSPPSGLPTTGDVYIGMVVDANGQVVESNESNNRNQGNGKDWDAVRVEDQRPDLLGTHFDADEPLRWGQSFHVDARIENLGTANAGTSSVKFYLSSDSTIDANDYYLGSRNIAAISAGSLYYLSNHPLPLPSSPPSGFSPTDDVYIGMIVDANGEVTETNESNNRNQGDGKDSDAVHVEDPRPDLVGAFFDAEEPVRWGQTINVNARIANQGLANAASSVVNFYLSSDSTISTADYYLGSRGIGAISASSSYFLANDPMPLPSSPPSGFTAADDVYIGMIVDAGGQVTESNENNNCNQGDGKDLDAVHVDAAVRAFADMIAFRPQHGSGTYAPFEKTRVEENDEESSQLGPGIRLNGDDDNRNGVPDRNDTAVGGEDDLIEVQLRVQGGTYVLARSTSRLKVWSSPTKGTGNEIPFTKNRSSDLTFPSSGERTVWVEYASASHTANARLTLTPAPGSPKGLPKDTIRFHTFRTIVVTLGGENFDPSVPRRITDNDQGVFVMTDALYEQGYDVFHWNEDNVDASGAGNTYDDVHRAVTTRGVKSVVIFGYSHGGGSAFDLADRLTRTRIGRILFTCYIDAIENDGFFDTDSETRRPPGSRFHVNYWQPNPSVIVWPYKVNGAPTVGANVNREYPNHVHSTIDNDAQIHALVLSDFNRRRIPR